MYHDGVKARGWALNILRAKEKAVTYLLHGGDNLRDGWAGLKLRDDDGETARTLDLAFSIEAAYEVGSSLLSFVNRHSVHLTANSAEGLVACGYRGAHRQETEERGMVTCPACKVAEARQAYEAGESSEDDG